MPVWRRPGPRRWERRRYRRAVRGHFALESAEPRIIEHALTQQTLPLAHRALIGGGGVAMGSAALIGQIKVMRTILGSNSDPDTAWLIQRSLGTLQLRMEQQQASARKIVDFLRAHPKVQLVAYPGSPDMGSRQQELCRSAMR